VADTAQASSPADAFSGFWQDFLSKLGMPAEAVAAPSPAFSSEAVRQMQRVFLDAMAKYCDDFLRSEQFLQMMKQTMDRSLAFKQQLDQFLCQVQKGVQTPARVDLDDLAGTLRTLQQSVLARLEALEKKVAAAKEPRARRRNPPSRRVARASGRGAVHRRGKKGSSR